LPMILPGRNKEFFFPTSLGIEWKDFFDDLWSQAAEALKVADKIVVCGYSLLLADKRAYEMILNVPQRDVRVEIVSGNQGERIAADFRKADFSKVSFDSVGYFEEWVKQHALAVAP
jgi:hypothetical protein